MRRSSRSRSRRGRQADRRSCEQRSSHQAERRSSEQRSSHQQPPARVSAREKAEAEARQLERRLRGEVPEQKSGQQKAREAVEKEREKARLKKLEREEAQKEKALNKERDRARRREDPVSDLDKQLEAGGAAASPVLGPRDREQALAAEGHQGEEATSTPAAPQLDEGLARKLFDLLDRSGKGQVSQRDVLIALKKQPPVRRLFGLPVTNVEEGGSELEARLLAIQDSFESGSGLGELGPVFEKLRAGGSCQAFGWEAFLASCREEPMQARAMTAVGLLPREHSTGPAFVATHNWAVVPEGAACPGGLEYKMDMETGRTLARLMPVKAANGPARAAGRSRVTTQTLACK